MVFFQEQNKKPHKREEEYFIQVGRMAVNMISQIHCPGKFGCHTVCAVLQPGKKAADPSDDHCKQKRECHQIARRSRNPNYFFTDLTSKQSSERSEEHTSELQSHSFISYAVFCFKK